MKNAASSFPDSRDHVTFMLNGVLKQARGQDVFEMTGTYLRQTLGLVGTKIVCAEGDCGACSVLLYSPFTKALLPINSCIFPVGLLDGGYVVTVEGLAQGRGSSVLLNEVQNALVKNHASQCGYCTPGIAITLQGLIESKKRETKSAQAGIKNQSTKAQKSAEQDLQNIDRKAVKNALTGNLCRCTGYESIVTAGLAASAAASASVKSTTSLAPSHAPSYFPQSAQIKKLALACQKPVWIETSDGQTFFAPTRLVDALAALGGAPSHSQRLSQTRSHSRAQHGDVALLGSCTDLGVGINKGNVKPRHLISLHRVQELLAQQKPHIKKAGLASPRVRNKNKHASATLSIGALTTIAQLREAFKAPLPEAARYLDLFASPQIKNVATVCGNLANASPIGDCAPLALTLDAVFTVALLCKSQDKTRGKSAKQASRKSPAQSVVFRQIPAAQFFKSYRKTALKKGELITEVTFSIPNPRAPHHLGFYKVSNRKDLDISNVNAGFLLQLNSSKTKIEGARVSFGGVGATPLRLKDFERALKGVSLETTSLLGLLPQIQKEIAPLSDARGSSAYRRLISNNLFLRFLAQHCGLEVLPL